MLAAVQHDGDALQLASADLQEDRAIVLAAVQRHGDALYYASAEIKGDREVVLLSCCGCGAAEWVYTVTIYSV